MTVSQRLWATGDAMPRHTCEEKNTHWPAGRVKLIQLPRFVTDTAQQWERL